jgi:hypothetical protein
VESDDEAGLDEDTPEPDFRLQESGPTTPLPQSPELPEVTEASVPPELNLWRGLWWVWVLAGVGRENAAKNATRSGRPHCLVRCIAGVNIGANIGANIWVNIAVNRQAASNTVCEAPRAHARGWMVMPHWQSRFILLV